MLQSSHYCDAYMKYRTTWVSRDFGQSFGNLTIPAEYTKDGKVHVVQNDEEFFKYMDLEKIPNKKMKEDIKKMFPYDVKN